MYWAWLATQLDCPLMPAPNLEAASHVPLVHLHASCGREAGYRNVKPAGLREKMRDIMVAKEFREWEKAVLCRVPELDTEEARSAANASGDAPEAASQHMKTLKTMRYVDFHHRACAMHFMAYSLNDRAIDLPGWFVVLAKKIPVEHKGALSKLEWRSDGLGRAASQQHGQVGLSWMDILQTILEEPAWAMSGGASLQDRVFQISPEYAAKLSDWKNMKTLATRVHKNVYDYLETAMAETGMSSPILPQTWLRDPLFVLKTARGKQGLAEHEQQVGGKNYENAMPFGSFPCLDPGS